MSNDGDGLELNPEIRRVLGGKPTDKSVKLILEDLVENVYKCNPNDIDQALASIAELIRQEKKDISKPIPEGTDKHSIGKDYGWNEAIDHLVKKINAPI